MRAKHFRPVLLIFASLATSTLWAQGTTARILGQVTDSSGALIPSASITATNEGTAETYRATTDTGGRYSIPLLPVGQYRLEAEATGFKKAQRLGLVLAVDQTAEIDLKLEIGNITETISVTATTPSISTETTEIGSVVQNKQIEEIPLNGRLNIVSLLVLAPGVQDFEDQSAVPTTGINPQVGGGGTRGTNFSLDGVSNNENNNIRGLGDWPPLQAIQEFKVVTSNASAQFGQGGSQVIVVSKSGTNQIHGSALWYNRNRLFAAQNALVKLAQKPGFNRNEYGGGVGGPIILPHFNGKDRTFFFTSWEGFKLRSPFAIAQTVPTAAMRAGNFNGIVNIKDPLAGGALFADNVIPASRIDPVAAKLASFYPLPTVLGTGPGGTGVNYVDALRNAQDVARFSLKLDHRFSANDNVAFRFLWVNLGPNPNTNNNTAFNIPGMTPIIGQIGEHERGYVLTDTHVVKSNVVNELTAHYRYLPVFRTPRWGDFNPATLLNGLPTPAFGGLPYVNISGFLTMTDTLPGSQDKSYMFEAIDNLTWTHGRHSVKFGYTAQWADNWNLANINANNSARGSLTFSNRYTGTANNNAFADFLLGYPTQTQRPGVAPATQFRSIRQYAYVQDDIRLRSNLTLNIGMRYEYYPVYSNRFGLASTFDPTLGRIIVFGDSMPAQALPQLLSTLPISLAKDVGRPSNLSDYIGQQRNNWGPRIGFAYSPTRHLVFRSGFGIYYGVIAMTFYKDTALLGGDPPFQAVNVYDASNTAPTITLANPFAGNGTTTANPAIGAIARGLKDPYSEQWNATMEYDLHGTGLRVSYVGNHGVHELGSYDLNAVQPLAATVQPRCPYQPFAAITYVSNPFGSNLNQLQLGATRGYHNGLTLSMQFQYTRALGTESYDSPFNGRLSYGNLAGIRRLGLVSSYVYELPFGRGRRFLNRKGVGSALAGGWEVTGIPSIFSGAPYNLTFSQNVTGCPTGRPSIVGDPNPASRSVSQWFNPASFTPPLNCTFGTMAPNSIFAPNNVKWDTGLYRNFQLREHLRLQFRSEAFNTLNHPQWGTPRNNISAANPGQITSTSGERQVQFALKLLW